MRVTASYDLRGTMGNAVEWATQREALGLDGIHFPEVARNPFTSLTLAAEHTDSIRIGTSVAIAFARSPYVMANLGWDLQEYSGGRLMLGLGTQVKGHNERRFSVPWGPPTARLREYVGMMRAVWHTWRTGERPAYEGDYYRYTLDSYVFNPGPIDYPDPQITIAAVRPRNTALGAEIADGVMWHGMLSWAYRDQVLLPAVEEGARAGGKDPKDLIISGGGFVITAPDEERLRESLGEARRTIAFYASTRTYQDSIKMAGYEDEGALLHRLSIEQRWAEMAKIVDDEFMEQFAIVATWDELPAKMAERYAGVNTEVGFGARIDTPEDAEHARDVIEQLRAIPAYGEVEPAAVAG